MSFITEIFTQPSYLQVVLLLSVVCAAGLALGGIRVKGVSLGVTFVFFAGIVLGDIMNRNGIQTDWKMISLAQNFGLILFVYALGVQVGPGFFTSLKKGGIKLNLYGLITIAVTTLSAIGVYAFTDISFPDSVGLLCGSVTNTPMLGAAQQTLLDIHPEQVAQANNMATACALAYPMGVIGVLFCLILFNVLGKGRNSIPKPDDSSGDTYVAEFHVSNPAIFGHTIEELCSISKKPLIISRLWRGGVVRIPTSDTTVQKDDHVMAVLSRKDLPTFKIIFGEQEATDWNRPDIDWDNIDSSGLVSRHVLVTKQELNGVKIGTLHLRDSFNISITRVNRAGILLVAYPGLRLQLGDRLTIVGDKTAIDKAAEILGNKQKELQAPNLVAVFLGVFLGVVLGCIPVFIPGMSTPVKLGIAGGPIIVGILMGAFGPRIHLSTYTTRSANLMMRQMGIVIYLACLGLSAGGGFAATVFCARGLQWVLISLLITIVPVLLCGFIASRFGHLDYEQNAGMLCAAMANPMALTYANANSDEQEASAAYATVYPLSMFIRVISAQVLMLAFL